ncbi:hypothetical protein P9X08_25960, partial [Bacillus cereus]|nr:hypothetical protein [Bacillus cereus]
LTYYIVCKHYGMDTSEFAIPYIAQWTKNGQDIEEKDKSIMRVHETASSFINTIDKKISELQRENEKNREQDNGDIKGQSNSEEQQNKVDHFLSNKTEKDVDAAAIKQQETRRIARMAYMQQMER